MIIFKWLLNVVKEFFGRVTLSVIGEPVAGCLAENEPPRPMMSSEQVKALPSFGGQDGVIDMDVTPTFNQGKTPYCVVFGVINAIETMLIGKYMDKAIYFDRFFYASKLIEAGILSERGAYIHRVLNWFHTYGITDTRGNEYGIEEAEAVPVAEIFNVMDKWYPLVTGAFWGYPYHDSNYIFLPKTLSTGGGHCTVFNKAYGLNTVTFNDGTTNPQFMVGTETSWGDMFGIKLKTGKGSGILYVLETDLPKFFTTYMIPDVHKIT